MSRGLCSASAEVVRHSSPPPLPPDPAGVKPPELLVLPPLLVLEVLVSPPLPPAPPFPLLEPPSSLLLRSESLAPQATSSAMAAPASHTFFENL